MIVVSIIVIVVLVIMSMVRGITKTVVAIMMSASTHHQP